MTHASLFSGIGGAEIAAEWVGWENLFHCEINPFGRKVLEYWYPNSVSYDDITKTDFTEWRGKIDVLTAGFPCQPFSVAGQRKGADDDRYLWPQVVRAVHEIRPAWVVGENVAGILTMVQPGEEVEVGSGSALFDENHLYRTEHSSTSSKPSAKTSSVKDIPSSRLLFRLVPSERPTDGTECGLLPTPTAQDFKGRGPNSKQQGLPEVVRKLLPSPVASDATTGAIIGKCDKFVATGNGTLRKVNRNGTNGSVGLARMVQLLPTPNASEGEKYTTRYNPDSQMGKGLTAMAVNALLPTPQARDYKGECHMTQSCLPNTFQTSQLNPLFVTEMMGFPLDWLVSPFQSGGPKPSKP